MPFYGFLCVMETILKSTIGKESTERYQPRNPKPRNLYSAPPPLFQSDLKTLVSADAYYSVNHSFNTFTVILLLYFGSLASF